MTKEDILEYEQFETFMYTAKMAKVPAEAFVFFLRDIRTGSSVVDAINYARREWDF